MLRATTSRGAEIAAGVVARHERLAAGVDEARAFAAQSLGNQKARRAGEVERGRMELHELEVGDAGAGAIRERDAVAGRNRRIGRLAEHLSGSAGGQQRGAGTKLPAHTALIEKGHPRHAAVLDQQFGDQRVMDGVDRREPADALPERPADLAAGRIAGVQHAPHAVRRLASEGGPPARIAIEARTPFEQFAHIDRAFLDEHLHRFRVAQAVTRPHRIGGMEFGAVLVAHRRGDSALGVPGIALGRLVLGQDSHPARGCQRYGRTQPGDAAADDQKISVAHQ